VQLLSRSSSSMVRVFELFSNFSFASFLSYARVCIPHSGYVRAAPQHFSSHDYLSFYRFGQDLYILEQQHPLHAVKCSIVPSFICHPQVFVTISFPPAVILFASVLHLVGSHCISHSQYVVGVFFAAAAFRNSHTHFSSDEPKRCFCF